MHSSPTRWTSSPADDVRSGASSHRVRGAHAPLFRERVEERGGTVVSVESYEAEDTTFTPLMQRLVKRDEPSKRADYRRAFAECKNAAGQLSQGALRARGGRRRSRRPSRSRGCSFPTPPIGSRSSRRRLAAEDIIVERDPQVLQKIEKTLGRKVEPITLLGTSAWNSPELPKKAGRTVENAIFADISFDGAGDEVHAKFVAGSRKHFERRPEHHEALLYDADALHAESGRRAPATTERPPRCDASARRLPQESSARSRFWTGPRPTGSPDPHHQEPSRREVRREGGRPAARR